MSIAIDADEQLHWLALQLVPGLGARKASQLVRHFDSPRAIFRASIPELEAFSIPGSTAQSILSGCTFEDAATQHHKMLSAGAILIALNDPLYPKRLKAIFDPPTLLFARGRIQLLDTVMLSIVGTRRPTQYGSVATERIARELAQAGLTIVSGMARGIDTAAHKAALDIKGNTVAVLGCGVDVVYPAENRKLADQIASEGLLISEFPMGTPGYPQNFPIRNRVVSGLSAGVLVVEGAKYSGSAITARLAIEQSRELFAIPGNITSNMSWGPNLLIKQGAKLVQDAEDVLSELSPEDRRRVHAARTGASAAPETLQQQQVERQADSPVARSTLQILMVDRPTHIDVILENLPQYSSSELIAALFELEMLGLIRQLAGKQFVKVW
ncbi:MAG TPA: DNA-processing protein DprA [Bryobacteraceae bacterium]|nr:DNA-processing protein DprA [Bryobacteraceae bacterium]